MAAIGLTMIVKNEALVIRRALDSVRLLVDYVLVCDTGSDDGTQRVIADWLTQNQMAGEVIDRPWVDFAHNRNEGIEALRARGDVDYALTIDADEYLVFDPSFIAPDFKESLGQAEAWRITTRLDSFKYSRLQLFSNRLPFRFRYKMHERVVPPEGSRIGTALGFFNQYTYDGARMRNPSKYLDDALVIEDEFASGGYDDPVGRRHGTYYLAQCYRDAKLHEKARDAYFHRTTLGGPQDEIAWSFYNAALLMEMLGESPDAVIATHLKAREFALDRAEPLCAAARIANINKLHDQAYILAKLAVDMPEPPVWPIDTSAYEWRPLAELQIAAIGTGRFDEAVELSERLLSEAKFPESERARIETNAAYALAQYDLGAIAAQVVPDARGN